jgi:peptidoglycan/xylan/chitin deacetylase (PgdA/CDA1 family)
MRLPGLKTLVQSGRWLRSRFALGGLILGYHRVAAAGVGAHGLRVSPEHFAEQLAVVKQLCQPVSLAQLVNGLFNGNLPRRAVALTFDDGYADILHQARPWLDYYAVPATVFVVTGSLGNTFWWDDLAHTLLRARRPASSLRLNIGGETWTLDASRGGRDDRPDHRNRLASYLYQRLLPLSASERCHILAQVRQWAGDPPATPDMGRSLTGVEVQQLSDDLVDIGVHTVSHPPLATQPVALQRSEIYDSKTVLEALLSRPVSAFSYPNGSASPSTRALVQAAGFQYACSSQPDVARRSSHRYQLPRFWVPDCDGDAFARWLRPWLRP